MGSHFLSMVFYLIDQLTLSCMLIFVIVAVLQSFSYWKQIQSSFSVIFGLQELFPGHVGTHSVI